MEQIGRFEASGQAGRHKQIEQTIHRERHGEIAALKPANEGQSYVLGNMERRTHQFICRRFGHVSFTLEEFLHAAPRDAAPAAYHAALMELCRKQVICMMRKTWGERLFQYPAADFLEYIRRDDKRAASLDGPSIDDKSIGRLARRSMSELLFSLLLEIEQEPLKVTQQGRLYKKNMEKLTKRLGTASTAVEEQIVLETFDLGLRMELIERIDGEVRVNEQRFMRWLDLDGMVRDSQLFLIWYRVHDPRSPVLQWITAAVRSLPSDRWIAVRTLLDISLHESIAPCEESEASGWLERLHASGWLELGIDDDGLRWIRNRSTASEDSRSLIVLHDLEIIAPPHTSFRVLRVLHQISDRLSWEEMQRFRISAASCYRAFEDGWTSDTIIQFLEEHTMDELPEEISAAIRRWEDSRALLRLMRGFILEAADDRAALIMRARADELSAMQVNERMWLVTEGDERELIARFEQVGLTITSQQLKVSSSANLTKQSPSESELPSSNVPNDGHDDAQVGVDSHALEERFLDVDQWVRAALLPHAPGIFTPQDATELYRKELPAAEAALEELYPDVRKIPAMWVEQARRYHPSTILQMIRQAIKWRTGILLRTAGREREFVPEEIVQSEAAYVVKGYCNSELSELRIEDIESIKLLLPGLLV